MNQELRNNFKKLFDFIKSNSLNIFFILLICFYCIVNAIGRITYSFYSPMNGDFQNYNVWRRLLDGQIPFKDFTVYLGNGHLYLGSFFTKLFGDSFTAGLFASVILTGATSAIVIFIITYFVTKSRRTSLSMVCVIFTVHAYRPSFIDDIIPNAANALDSLFYPGTSARSIRVSIIFILAIFAYLAFYIVNKFVKQDKKYVVYITLMAFLSGASIAFSNDGGISAFIAASGVFFLFLIKQYKKDILSILKWTCYWSLVSIVSLVITLFILTKGNPLSWLEFTMNTSYYQSWYFGIYTDSRIYNIKLFRLSFSECINLSILLYNIYFFYKRKESSYKEYLSHLSLIFIFAGAFTTSMLNKLLSGGALNEIMVLIAMVGILSYIAKLLRLFMSSNINYSKGTKSTFLGILIFTFCIFLQWGPGIYSKYNSVHREDNVSQWIEGFSGYLNDTDAATINQMKDYLNGGKVFSTYATALETVTDQYQPTGTDYIIHVLSDQARKEYLDIFRTNDHKYAITMNQDIYGWEHWVRSANWFFYRELYRDYEIADKVGYGVFWKTSDKPNILDANVDINVEVLSDDKYKITCNSYETKDGIVDLKIGYTNEYKKGRLLKGAIRKGVFVNDITQYSLFSTPTVNYYLPPESDEYYIPITLVDGHGEIEISSLPQSNTKLSINNYEIMGVLENPFIVTE